jgi:flagellar hook-associated protein 1 FlgK
MTSTFHGIEMGKRSLITHTQALNTTGHNLANMNTEGYSRQVIHFEEYEPIYMPDLTRAELPGMLGEGVMTSRIERVRDVLIDNRLIFESANLGYYDTLNKYIHQMELVYSEPSETNDPSFVNTLRTSFDNFMSAWSDLANHPDETAARIALVEKANILTNSVRHHFDQFTDIRKNVDKELQERVIEINQLAQKIAHLNDRILRSEAVKDNPNDLYDQRDLLIDRLSKIVDVQISREDKDELILYIGGKMLVQGQKYEQLNLVASAENDGYYDVYWRDDEKLVVRGGELAALADLRDDHLYHEIKKIDSFAANVTDLVNEIHKDGFGANGKTGNNFFVEFPFTNDPLGNYDRNKDGQNDSTYIFRVSGSNKLDEKDKVGIQGQLNINGIIINYYATDTVLDIIKRINEANTRVTAFLNPQNKLTLKADYQENNTNPDFVIQHLEDSGLFLVGYAGILQNSGAAGAFDWNNVNQINQFTANSQWAVAPLVHPAAYMIVDQNILKDPLYIAAANGLDINGDGIKETSNGVGDSSNALRISSLKHEKVMVGLTQTFSEYFENLITDIGSKGNLAQKGFKAAEVITKNLENIRKSISGVNIDEEFANLIKFQHGYNATAKIMTEMDKMIETLIFRLGA